jgi:hypothetical protein
LAISLQSVRKLALSLPDTTEEPHHHFGSFRVRGKIFATIPPGEKLLHLFLPDAERELALAMDPEFLEPVVWGKKVVGVRANLPLAKASTVRALVQQAYQYKATAASTRRAKSSVSPSVASGHAKKSAA